MPVLSLWRRLSRLLLSGSVVAAIALAIATPAFAHHPFGNQTPSTALEGLLSGLGHPVIGMDHLVFMMALGLLGAISYRGWLIPAAFVTTTLVGTGLHLAEVHLPGLEIWIAASVVVAGALLAQSTWRGLALSTGLGAIAGIFHGYAYGEAIVGAEPTPLVAYLAGFGLIQLAIALVVAFLCRHFAEPIGVKVPQPLRFAGLAIAGAGLAFLAAATGL